MRIYPLCNLTQGFQFRAGRTSRGGDCVDCLVVFITQGDEFLACRNDSSANGGNSSANRRTNATCYTAQLLKLAASRFSLLSGFLYGITEFIHVAVSIFKRIGHIPNGLLIGGEFLLHAVKGSLCLVQLDLPVLGSAVIFTEGVGCILERTFQGSDFLLLGIDGLTEGFVSGGQRFHRFVLLVEL